MELFHKMLKTAFAGEASDVHLKIGNPVVFRIHRELLAIECPSPTQEWMSNVVEHVAPPHLKTRLEQEREIDFSYFVTGVGRFRVFSIFSKPKSGSKFGGSLPIPYRPSSANGW